MSKSTETKDRKKTPLLSAPEGAEHKHARGLSWPFTKAQKEANPHVAGFSLQDAIAVEGGKRATVKIARGQFGKRHFYYSYMSAKAHALGDAYAELAKDAKAHPDKYRGTRANVQARIDAATSAAQAKLDAVFAAGLQALVASGMEEDAARKLLQDAQGE